MCMCPARSFLALVWFPFVVAGRRLWVTMRGDTSGQVRYHVVATPAVQISLVLAISVEDFYGPNIINNIATLLQVTCRGLQLPLLLCVGLELACSCLDTSLVCSCCVNNNPDRAVTCEDCRGTSR